MNTISVKCRIDAPPERVFSKATALGEAPRFIRAIKSLEVLTPGPVGKGTRFRETRTMFGRDATEEMEVTEFEPPRRFVLGARNHGCRYRSEMLFRPAGSGTEVEMSFTGEPLTFAAKVMSVVLRPMMKSMAKICAKDLEDLKAAVERGN